MCTSILQQQFAQKCFFLGNWTEILVAASKRKNKYVAGQAATTAERIVD
jgi:hypothetical protein